ncbi:YicC/YloC family endoribonuclease [Labilibaculum sp. K2S]|uniref:YicC/YloC family endoribonuclease n=1 Tax=Labilibaculum sp. K2S TaxID=3056386 RepID=UPI0025A3C85E|nr:YicC/YloC family endoribonuclease [Labilibaculum sp. K2S]MDM8159455.1 YicC/YloC family endoribonuclease [Labilibaculum sp. K2S]
MLISMTGFGKAILELENKKVSIEIKSLNSKQLDINTRIPNLYKEKDLVIRNEIKNKLERGKVELSIFIESVGTDKETKINKPIVEAYYKQLNELAQDLGIAIDKEPILQTIVKLPDALKVEYQELDEEEWNLIFEGFKTALAGIMDFRNQEGNALQEDIFARIANIENLLAEVPQYENDRIETVRTRINDNLRDFVEKQNVDKNRFEQEIIYYLEKLDITEEKVRLANHCKYFIETSNAGNSEGKKLGFIAQEIGREINTLGSKANDSNIQKIVIDMKDELEKIKEQLLNVL